jgi:hypothetical protein
LNSCDSREELTADPCENDRPNESSGPTKGGKFLYYLSDYQLLKKDSVPCRSWLVSYLAEQNRNQIVKCDNTGHDTEVFSQFGYDDFDDNFN